MSCPKLRLSRLIKKRSDKHTWFQNNPETPETSSPEERSENKKPVYSQDKIDLRKTLGVLAIPRTHGGALVRELRGAEANIRSVCHTKVRVTEQVGQTLRLILCKSNPWINTGCPRVPCMPCKFESNQACWRRSVLY